MPTSLLFYSALPLTPVLRPACAGLERDAAPGILLGMGTDEMSLPAARCDSSEPCCPIGDALATAASLAREQDERFPAACAPGVDPSGTRPRLLPHPLPLGIRRSSLPEPCEWVLHCPTRRRARSATRPPTCFRSSRPPHSPRHSAPSPLPIQVLQDFPRRIVLAPSAQRRLLAFHIARIDAFRFTMQTELQSAMQLAQPQQPRL